MTNYVAMMCVHGTRYQLFENKTRAEKKSNPTGFLLFCPIQQQLSTVNCRFTVAANWNGTVQPYWILSFMVGEQNRDFSATYCETHTKIRHSQTARQRMFSIGNLLNSLDLTVYKWTHLTAQIFSNQKKKKRNKFESIF